MLLGVLVLALGDWWGYFPYLELVLEDVLLGGQLAVEPEQALLLWGEGLDC